MTVLMNLVLRLILTVNPFSLLVSRFLENERRWKRRWYRRTVFRRRPQMSSFRGQTLMFRQLRVTLRVIIISVMELLLRLLVIIRLILLFLAGGRRRPIRGDQLMMVVQRVRQTVPFFIEKLKQSQLTVVKLNGRFITVILKFQRVVSSVQPPVVTFLFKLLVVRLLIQTLETLLLVICLQKRRPGVRPLSA